MKTNVYETDLYSVAFPVFLDFQWVLSPSLLQSTLSHCNISIFFTILQINKFKNILWHSRQPEVLQQGYWISILFILENFQIPSRKGEDILSADGVLSSFRIVWGGGDGLRILFWGFFSNQMQSHAFRIPEDHLRPDLVRMHAEDTIKSRYSCGACGFSVQKHVVTFLMYASCWKVQLWWSDFIICSNVRRWISDAESTVCETTFRRMWWA